MGLVNWLLKNGPGSPGSTAKTFVKEYRKIAVNNHNEEWEGAFHALFLQRYLANQSLGFRGGSLLGQVDPNEIIGYSNGDMALFVFYMMLLETANFRNNINNTFNDVTAVIYQVIKDEAPSALKYNLETFRFKASQL